MSPAIEPPGGFVVVRNGPATLVVDPLRVSPEEQERLAAVAGWVSAASPGETGRGRGQTEVRPLARGGAARLKQLRRGGLAAPLWADRFPGRRRILDNVELPRAARSRGIATPAPLALLLVEGPPALFRAWLATEEIEGARDLGERIRSGRPPTPEEQAAIGRLVRRMHDAGLEHRDLNLGNLLLRAAADGAAEAFVVDLDGARLHASPLSFGKRLAALSRLERSLEKQCGATPLLRLSRCYAAHDLDLERRLDRGLQRARVWLPLHRLGWRRSGS